jgi:hypothetical protein
LLFSVLLAALAFYWWWNIVYTSPEAVFRGMLERNFKTSGFTRIIEVDEKGTQQKQISQIQSGVQNVAVSRIESRSEKGDTQTAEVIALPDADYVRYIELDYKNEAGEKQDFSKAVNVWARQPSSGDLSQSYAQLTLFRTYFPMAAVSADERSELLKLIDQKTVYNVQYDKVKKEAIDGQRVYTYPVSVQMQAYTDLVMLFGESIGQQRITDKLDPAQSAGAEPAQIEVSVDIVSRRLVQVRYAGSDDVKERYTGFGIQKTIPIPEKYVSTVELQQRLVPSE